MSSVSDLIGNSWNFHLLEPSACYGITGHIASGKWHCTLGSNNISFLQTSATGFISLGSIPIQVLYGSDTSVIFPGDIGMSSIRGRLGNLPACSPRNFLLFYAVDSRNDG